MEEYNVVLLGDAGVGKTALCIQYVRGEFAVDYDPTIFDKFAYQSEVDGKMVDMRIHDTAGQGDYTSFIPGWIRNGHAFILLFSLTDRESFDKIRSIYLPQICEVLESKEIPVVLVGNKVDLLSRGHDREVPEADIQALASEYDCGFFETSAKTRHNLSMPFQTAIRQARLFSPVEATKFQHATQDHWCPLL
jgi:GTPase KRas protein